MTVTMMMVPTKKMDFSASIEATELKKKMYIKRNLKIDILKKRRLVNSATIR